MALDESPAITVPRRGSAAGDAQRTAVWFRGEHDTSTKDALLVLQLCDLAHLVDQGVT